MASVANAWVACLDRELDACLQCPVILDKQKLALIRALQHFETKYFRKKIRQDQVNRIGRFLNVVYHTISPEMFLLLIFSITSRMFLAKHPTNLLQILLEWFRRRPRSNLLLSFAEEMRPRIVKALSKYRDIDCSVKVIVKAGVSEEGISGSKAKEETQSIQSQHATVRRSHCQENETQEEEIQDNIENKETQNQLVSWEDVSRPKDSWCSEIFLSDIVSVYNETGKDQAFTLTVDNDGTQRIDIPKGFCQRLLMHVRDKAAARDQGGIYSG